MTMLASDFDIEVRRNSTSKYPLPHELALVCRHAMFGEPASLGPIDADDREFEFLCGPCGDVCTRYRAGVATSDELSALDTWVVYWAAIVGPLNMALYRD